MSEVSQLQPITPAQIRAALTRHLAKKLGWCGKTAAYFFGPLSNDQIAGYLASCREFDTQAVREDIIVKALARIGLCGISSAVA
ncbi:hypothetical protein [Methylobacterium sp. CM6244]